MLNADCCHKNGRHAAGLNAASQGIATCQSSFVVDLGQLGGCRLTDEFIAMLAWNISKKPGGRSAGCGTCSYFLPANQPSTTVMRFSVKVPVCTSSNLSRSAGKLSHLSHLIQLNMHIQPVH